MPSRQGIIQTRNEWNYPQEGLGRKLSIYIYLEQDPALSVKIP